MMTDIQSLFSETRGLRLKLARELGLSPGAVYQWRKVPAERVLDVERITGIPRHQLRPDLYLVEDAS